MYTVALWLRSVSGLCISSVCRNSGRRSAFTSRSCSDGYADALEKGAFFAKSGRCILGAGSCGCWSTRCRRVGRGGNGRSKGMISAACAARRAGPGGTLALWLRINLTPFSCAANGTRYCTCCLTLAERRGNTPNGTFSCSPPVKCRNDLGYVDRCMSSCLYDDGADRCLLYRSRVSRLCARSSMATASTTPFFSRVATDDEPRGVNTLRNARTLFERHGHGRDSDTGTVCHECCDIAGHGVLAHAIHGHFMYTRS